MSENAPSPDVSIDSSTMRIELQVGERIFVTTRETLIRESGYFQSLLSIDGDKAIQNGLYFIDADPDLFDHILRYLRRGVLPLFYDRSKGHNHMLYIALLQEAKFFQIKRLEEWIQGGKYLDTVTTMHTMNEIDWEKDHTEIEFSDVELQYYPVACVQDVYLCPRGIEQHRGKPDACGKRCRSEQGEFPDQYVSETVVKAFILEKKTIINSQRCVGEGK